MKNVHILPTDKPSRFCLKITDGFQGFDFHPYNERRLNTWYKPQHIYITSDEEIKEGNYVVEDIGGGVYGPIDRESIVENPKKIILTTDQDLIKDGVQAIDDKFLEWFVKNPSCESVEISHGLLKPFQSIDKGYMIHLPDNEVLEEPKQDLKKIIEEVFEEILNEEKPRELFLMNANSVIDTRIPKKETLEEAAEINLTRLCYYDKRNPDFQIKEEYGYDKEEVEATGNFSKKDCACDNCFYGRSKLTEQLIWQQDKNKFSEEDMKLAFETGRNFQLTGENNFNELIEQFKKK